MNRNHVCDICDTEAESWTQIPITEGWLTEDGYPFGRETSLVICDDCFEKLREMIVEFPRATTFYSGDRPVETITIHEQPTVDAEPVKHGHWIGVSQTNITILEKLFFPSRLFKCSVCGNYLDFDGVNSGRGDENYCPNCGARMDEVEDDT